MIARIVLVGWLRPALALTLAALSLSCRGTLGAHCRCAADCRAGLVCAAEGEKTLSGELCYDPGIVGECIESIEIDTDGGSDGDLTEAPMYSDLPSKRDFQPGSSLAEAMTSSDTGTDTGTGTTGTTSSTSTSSSTSGTSTGDTDTSSGTGTSTGTTGTSTGTTGTSTGTTSGTTGESTGSTGSTT